MARPQLEHRIDFSLCNRHFPLYLFIAAAVIGKWEEALGMISGAMGSATIIVMADFDHWYMTRV